MFLQFWQRNLWVSDPRTFHNSFFLKTIIQTLVFFKYLGVISLYKIFKNLKKYVSHQKIAWHSKRHKKKIWKRKRKTKNSNQNLFSRFFVYKNICMEIYFVRKHIWKSLVYIVTFVLKSFWMVVYWRFSNKRPTLT